MCDTLRREFQLSNFTLKYHSRKEFYTSQWQWNPLVFLAIRLFFALYTVGAYISVLIHWTYTGFPLLVFLTHWTYILLIGYFIVTLVTTIYFYCTETDVTSVDGELSKIIISSGKNNPTYNSTEDDQTEKPTDETETFGGNVMESQDDGDVLPWYLKLSWLLGNIVHPGSILVTFIYFTSIFPNNQDTRGNLFDDLNVHAFNSVFVIIDAAVIARPVKLLHFIYTDIFGLIYLVVNIIFWSLDRQHNVIYSLLNWNKPSTSVPTALGIIFIAVPLLQLMYFVIYRLRVAIYKRVYNKDF